MMAASMEIMVMAPAKVTAVENPEVEMVMEMETVPEMDQVTAPEAVKEKMLISDYEVLEQRIHLPLMPRKLVQGQ